MLNLDQVVENFSSQSGQLGERMRQAQSYRQMAATGQMSADELREVLQDLQRLDNIQLSAAELDQQIAFNECFEALKSLPLN